MTTKPSRLSSFVSSYWRTAVLVATPLLLLPLPVAIGSTEANCAFVLIFMSVFWITEVVPLPVTAMFPIFLFPLLGILDVKKTCAHYLSDTNFLFVGGLMLAIAVEDANLHRRLALGVLLWVGSKPHWIMLGFMATTAFLSMWMSNTATTAMMLPIAIAITDELATHNRRHRHHHRQFPSQPDSKIPLINVIRTDSYNAIHHVESEYSMEESPHHQPTFHLRDVSTPFLTALQRNEVADEETQVDFASGQEEVSQAEPDVDLAEEEEIPFDKLPSADQRVCKGILLSICYAANIGGTATLTGTAPNLVLTGQLSKIFPNAETNVNFFSWMQFAFPPMVITLVISWLWLRLLFLRQGWTCRKTDNEKSEKSTAQHESSISHLLRKKYEELGSVSYAEGSILVLFIVLVILWITRDPGFVPGWGSLFRKNFTTDSCAAVLIASLLFILPKHPPALLLAIFRRPKPSPHHQHNDTLLHWTRMQSKFPWGVIILLGGGFAMADGVKSSGLSMVIGGTLKNGLDSLSPGGICIITVIIVAFFTEIASNTSTASIMIPIMIGLAQSLCVNPLYFSMPITIATSFAFMLPVATPPNAIVYGSGRLKIIDMASAGFCMNLICIFILLINVNSWTYWLFDLGTFPTWAIPTGANITANFTCVR